MKYFIFVLLVVIMFSGCVFATNDFSFEVIGAGNANITCHRNQSGEYPHTWINEPLPFDYHEKTSRLIYTVIVDSINIVTLSVYYDGVMIYTETGIDPQYN